MELNKTWSHKSKKEKWTLKRILHVEWIQYGEEWY